MLAVGDGALRVSKHAGRNSWRVFGRAVEHLILRLPGSGCGQFDFGAAFYEQGNEFAHLRFGEDVTSADDDRGDGAWWKLRMALGESFLDELNLGGLVVSHTPNASRSPMPDHREVLPG